MAADLFVRAIVIQAQGRRMVHASRFGQDKPTPWIVMTSRVRRAMKGRQASMSGQVGNGMHQGKAMPALACTAARRPSLDRVEAVGGELDGDADPGSVAFKPDHPAFGPELDAAGWQVCVHLEVDVAADSL